MENAWLNRSAFFFLKRAKNLLPYINIGEENMGMAEAKRKRRKLGGETEPPPKTTPQRRLA
jgi:hypothetical protein